MKPLEEWVHLLFDKKRPPSSIIFRVDGGCVPGVSFGHLSRCRLIADAVANKYNAKTYFLIRDFPEGLAYLKKSGHGIQRIPVDSSAQVESEIINRVIHEFRAHTLIVDLPYSNTDVLYYERLSSQGLHTIFIDDSRFISPKVDILLNSSVLAPKMLKNAVAADSKRTLFLLGTDFFIFNPPLKYKPMPQDHRGINILLTFGGSDLTSITKKVVEVILNKDFESCFFKVILGPGNNNIQTVKDKIGFRSKNIQLIINPDDLVAFLQECDIGICAGGRTMYEFLYLKKKFLPIASTPEEAQGIQEFINQGLIKRGLTIWDPGLFHRSLTELMNESLKAGDRK